MTDETKKLFDAPWKVRVCEKGNPEFESVLVAKKTGWLVGRDMEYKTAKRVARLPELYEALLDLLYTGCVNCYSATYQLMAHDAAPTIEFFLENRCPKGQRDCPYNKAWRLIKNVRGGE